MKRVGPEADPGPNPEKRTTPRQKRLRQFTS